MPDTPRVQYELMLPHELEARMAACPTALVPLGTLEWHDHNSGDTIHNSGTWRQASRCIRSIRHPLPQYLPYVSANSLARSMRCRGVWGGTWSPGARTI